MNELCFQVRYAFKAVASALAMILIAGQCASAQEAGPPAAPNTAQPSTVPPSALPALTKPASTIPTSPPPSTLPPAAHVAPTTSPAPPAVAPPAPAVAVPAAAPVAKEPAALPPLPATEPAERADQSEPENRSATPVTAYGVAGAAPADKIPHDLTPWGMFMQADAVVKSVMIGLLLASLVTWTVWLAKSIELAAAKRRLRGELHRLSMVKSLGEAAKVITSQRGAVPAMLRAAIGETRASWDVTDKQAIMGRIEARLQRVEAAAGRDISRGTGVLASIGSVAPFVGLFGTVWGIMNSFIGISQAQTTNLAIVAPGIAEALQATAFGLVAAIPAVIVYNHFSRSIGGYKALVGDAGVAVTCLASRDFDRGVRPEIQVEE